MSVKFISSTAWGLKQDPTITRRRVSKLCQQNRIDGVQLVGSNYMIPEDSEYIKMPSRVGASA